MPSDITGTEVIEENRSTGHREFKFLEGPLFANVILADEINRTPPKTHGLRHRRRGHLRAHVTTDAPLWLSMGSMPAMGASLSILRPPPFEVCATSV